MLFLCGLCDCCVHTVTAVTYVEGYDSDSEEGDLDKSMQTLAELHQHMDRVNIKLDAMYQDYWEGKQNLQEMLASRQKQYVSRIEDLKALSEELQIQLDHNNISNEKVASNQTQTMVLSLSCVRELVVVVEDRTKAGQGGVYPSWIFCFQHS